MASRPQTISARAVNLLLLAFLFAALACASLARTRAQSDEGRTQTTSTPTPTPTPAPTQTQTPTPSQTPTPPPTPTPSPTPAPGPAPEEDVERIESDVTNVLLSATDKSRRFVTTLRQEDLRLTEDGVPQQITFFQQQTDTPLSLVLLVDTSASQEKVMSDERDAASAFVRSVLRPGKDNVSVLSFTGITRLDLLPTSDAARLLSAIGGLKVEYTEDNPLCKNEEAPEEEQLRCRTGVWDAVSVSVREVLSKTPETTRRAVILLSDGDDTSSRLRLYQAVEYAVRNNSVVYSIGIRDRDFRYGSMRKDFLRDISEQTGGRAFFPKNADDLASAFSQIEQELRSQYLISYTPTNRAKDGSFRRVRLEITNPQLRKQNLRLLYRQGYYAGNKSAED